MNSQWEHTDSGFLHSLIEAKLTDEEIWLELLYFDLPSSSFYFFVLKIPN